MLENIFKIAAAILFSIATAGVIIFGLSSWLGKVWANRILESEKAKHDKMLAELQDKLRQQTEKKIYIHKIQFEKEFLIYEKIWEKLCPVQSKVRALRPIIDQIDSREDEEVRKKRRLNEAGQVLEDFCKEVEFFRPFYPEKVYQKLNILLKICINECHGYRLYDSQEDHKNIGMKR